MLEAFGSRLAAALADRYRIERELGAGGMATVYLAHDLKHDRKVAIKVLKPELAAVLGAERFVVEIRTTASLQHPHILPLFDSGTADGFLFYVMPYIEGETIRDKLNRETQFGIDEAVRITREVADALDYAHRHGVIHRDIKPENILLHDGRAMVMDFGIALAVSAAAGGRMTETGLSLGTPHYMSPEQATAEKDLTPRSDVYSLGSVLFEMLAGEPPHTAGSAQAVIMKIVTDVARPVNELRRNVPPNVAAAVATALEKLPADRFPSAREFADALANRGFEAARHPPRSLVVAAVVMVALAAAGGWLVGRRGQSTAAPTVVSLSVVLPDSTPLDPVFSNAEGQPVLDVSPDGTTVAYVGRKGSGTQLYLRRLGTFAPRPIDGTDGAVAPFFSSDGSAVAFFAGSKLMRASVADGHVTQIADGIYEAWGGHWASDGRMVISYNRASALLVLGAGGDSVASMTCGTLCSLPQLLPDGHRVLVTGAGSTVQVADLTDGRIVPLRRFGGTADAAPTRGSMARSDGDGHLVWISPTGDVMAAPFDAGRATVTGPPATVAQGVRVETGRGAAQFALSAAGLVAYAPGSVESVGILVRSDRAGRLDTVRTTPTNFTRLELNPDGVRILTRIDEPGGSSTLGVVDAGTGQWTPWVAIRDRSDGEGWDPDGIHAWYRIGNQAFRGNPALAVAPDSFPVQPGTGFQILSDGKRYRFFRNDSTIIARLDGSGPPLAVATHYGSTGPVTADDRWIVQEEQVGRQSGIVARALDGSGRFAIVSNRQDLSMVSTTPHGTELFLGANDGVKSAAGATNGTQSFWAVTYSPGAATPFGQPTFLFRAPVADVPGRNYGVGMKGQRFVFKQHIAGPPLREIRIVQGWHAALGGLEGAR